MNKLILRTDGISISIIDCQKRLNLYPWEENNTTLAERRLPKQNNFISLDAKTHKDKATPKINDKNKKQRKWQTFPTYDFPSNLKIPKAQNPLYEPYGRDFLTMKVSHAKGDCSKEGKMMGKIFIVILNIISKMATFSNSL